MNLMSMDQCYLLLF
uniref:Uncharacterized protein n=1 Tax=Arundo donax TaxID=35708 RepID=A0A0A9E891_ARUDO